MECMERNESELWEGMEGGVEWCGVVCKKKAEVQEQKGWIE